MSTTHHLPVSRGNNTLRELCFSHQQSQRSIQERVMGLLTKLGPYPAFRDRSGNKNHLFCANPLMWNPELHLTMRELCLSSFPFYIFVTMLSLYSSICFLGKSSCEFRCPGISLLLLTISLKFVSQPLIPNPIIPSYALLGEHKFSSSSGTFQPLPYGLPQMLTQHSHLSTVRLNVFL